LTVVKFVPALLAAVASLTATASAQTHPSRPVTMVIPSAAGAPTDVRVPGMGLEVRGALLGGGRKSMRRRSPSKGAAHVPRSPIVRRVIDLTQLIDALSRRGILTGGDMQVSNDLIVRETRSKIFSNYFAIVPGILTPIIVALATFYLTRLIEDAKAEASAQQARAARAHEVTVRQQECVKVHLSIIELQSKVEVLPHGQKPSYLASNIVKAAKLHTDVCKELKIELPAIESDILKQAATNATTPASAKQVQSVVESQPLASQASVEEVKSLIANPPPRVYFHIVDEAQRAAARAVELRLETEKIDNREIVVPGIERLRNSVSKTVLRCFRKAECTKEAPQILAKLNAILVQPAVLEDLSATYENSQRIRPLHFELIFAPGQIQEKK
jgi:hypothetical protein